MTIMRYFSAGDWLAFGERERQKAHRQGRMILQALGVNSGRDSLSGLQKFWLLASNESSIDSTVSFSQLLS